MKNVKSLLIYGIIAVLCIAAFAGYLIKDGVGGSTGAASAGGQATASPTAAAPSKTDKVAERMKKSAQTPDPNPVVGIGRGEDYAKVTRSAVDNAGGLKNIVRKGDTVLIKPNICGFSQPGSPVITDYRMVQELVNMAREYGASKITIAEGPITGTAFDPEDAKINGYANISGVELVDLC